MDIESKVGRSFRAMRCRDSGHFSRSSAEINLIMTIEPGNPLLPPGVRGSVENPRKWWRITPLSVDQDVFSDYINYVASDIEQNPLPDGLDGRKIFMWDNLSVHGTALVSSTLELRPTRQQHRFIPVPRPPYMPEIGPIEFIFGEISSILSRKCARHWGRANLEYKIHNACVMVGWNGTINQTFRHCGY